MTREEEEGLNCVCRYSITKWTQQALRLASRQVWLESSQKQPASQSRIEVELLCAHATAELNPIVVPPHKQSDGNLFGDA